MPVFLDGARFAENAWFIQQREAGCERMSIREIVRAMTDCADGMLMSSKKDGLVNIGGFIAVRDKALYDLLAPRRRHRRIFDVRGLGGRAWRRWPGGLEEVVDDAVFDRSHRAGGRAGQALDRAACPC